MKEKISSLLSLQSFFSPLILASVESILVRKTLLLQSRNQATDPSTLPMVSLIVLQVETIPQRDSRTEHKWPSLQLEKIQIYDTLPIIHCHSFLTSSVAVQPACIWPWIITVTNISSLVYHLPALCFPLLLLIPWGCLVISHVNRAYF